MATTFKADQFSMTKGGLYVRPCTKWDAGPHLDGAHYRCQSWTFSFDLPENPEMGEWTIVAAGPDDCAAYVKAYRFMTTECVDDGSIVRLTEQERGEPGPLALYGWNDARTGCELPAWEEE
ncbi:hypothetical protein [Streptomyces lasiicapitis]|uniref:hypothetical protein n=1 Tax=Streptomyces lasiicapitis TaxID=1923961 RepID=UPI003654317C